MNLIDRAKVIHFHRHRIAEFGIDSVRSLGWVSETSQANHFEAISQAADFNNISVLDLGCGTGDLKAFLDARFSGLSYLGIDQVAEFVETEVDVREQECALATRQHPCARGHAGQGGEDVGDRPPVPRGC